MFYYYNLRPLRGNITSTRYNNEHARKGHAHNPAGILFILSTVEIKSRACQFLLLTCSNCNLYIIYTWL